MIKNPEDFILNSNIDYPEIFRKGSTDTTNNTGGPVVLTSGVPEGATWLIGMYDQYYSNPGSMRSGTFGYVVNGELRIDIQRQSAGLNKEVFYWRIYAD